MKKRLSYALKSLQYTLPISFMLLIVLWSWALSDNETINYTDHVTMVRRELFAVVMYVLFWGIPVVTLISRFANYPDELSPKFYRYTTNGEGVWSAGKRLLPENLVQEAVEHKKWMSKPNLPEGNYTFFFTQKGKDKYEVTLLNTHKKYLPNIICEEFEFKGDEVMVYQDEWQVVLKNKV